MTYQIILQRDKEYRDVKKLNKVQDSTLGTLQVLEQGENGYFKPIYTCYTCENIGESTDTPNQDKRIMPRKYRLEWTDSARNASLAKQYPKYKMPNGRNKAIWLTCDEVLPSFRSRRILIHVGNYPQDTEGCILLGKSRGNGTISQSILACNEFFELMEKIGLENIEYLKVKEIN